MQSLVLHCTSLHHIEPALWPLSEGCSMPSLLLSCPALPCPALPCPAHRLQSPCPDLLSPRAEDLRVHLVLGSKHKRNDGRREGRLERHGDGQGGGYCNATSGGTCTDPKPFTHTNIPTHPLRPHKAGSDVQGNHSNYSISYHPFVHRGIQ